MMTAHTLHQFTRWVALWFVFSLGAAIVSPLIQPQAMGLICSGAGAMKVIMQTDDGAIELGSHGLDCPLCANLGAPPPQLMVLTQPGHQACSTSQTLPTVQSPCEAHEPWQARAPPAFP